MTVHTIKFSALEAVRLERDGECIKASAMLAGHVLGSRLVPVGQVAAVMLALEQLSQEVEQVREREALEQGRAAA